LTAQALALNNRQGLQLLSKAIERNRFDPDLYLYRGEMAHAVTFQEGASPELTRRAVADLDMALAAYPRNSRVLDKLLFFLVFHRNHLHAEEASQRTEELLAQWNNLAPDDPNPKRYRMLHYRSLGDLDKAIEVGLAAHREHPNARMITHHLATGYMRMKKYEEAVGYWDQLIDGGSSDVLRYAKRALCHIRLGDIDAARRDLNSAVALPDHERWLAIQWDAVLRGFREVNDLEAVETLLRERLGIFRDKFGEENLATLNALYGLALFLERQDRSEKAEQLYDEAFQTSRRLNNEDHPFTIKCIEKLLYLVGRVKTKRGITAAPVMLAAPYHQRARRRAEQGDCEAAALDFSRAIELLPAQPQSGSPARRAYYWSAFEWNEVYDRLKVIRADDSDLPCERGLYLATRGRYKEALEHFQSGQLGDSPYRRWSHLAFLLLLNGRQKAYRLLCRQAADRYDDELGYTSRYFLNSICTVGQTSGIEPEVFHEWSDRHWENGNCDANAALVAGACSYRAGRFEQAIERLQRANTPLAAAESSFVRAMAYHQLNEPDLSRNWYERGVKALQGFNLSTIHDTSRYAMPYNWMRWNLEYREATNLLGLEPDEELINSDQSEKTPQSDQPANDNESNAKKEQ
jgi:tetratricopeptide (TPR) repeat protein